MEKNILLIDDDQVQHFITKATFKKLGEGFKLRCFLSAVDALEYLKELKDENLPSHILLDINMPEMNGWEFLDVYSKFEKTSPVIIVSSSIDIQDINKSKQYSVVIDFISKPLEVSKLSNLLTDFIKN